MKKAEINLYCAQLVECGKALALASMMEKESPAREAAERICNDQIDGICKQLELLCEDADFRKL